MRRPVEIAVLCDDGEVVRLTGDAVNDIIIPHVTGIVYHRGSPLRRVTEVEGRYGYFQRELGIRGTGDVVSMPDLIPTEAKVGAHRFRITVEAVPIEEKPCETHPCATHPCEEGHDGDTG